MILRILFPGVYGELSPFVKTIGSYFQGVNLVCFVTANCIIAVIVNQLRIYHTDKNPGIAKTFRNRSRILSGMLQYDTGFAFERQNAVWR